MANAILNFHFDYLNPSLTLTCVVLHHVLIVSVGGLGEVHAHALDALDAPHGMPPCPKEG